MSSHFYTTAYLLFLISLGYFATDIYLPSLPALATYFHASENEVQMTLFSYLLSFSFTPLVFGPLSDHIGRKKVILGGILVSMLGTLGCLFSPTIFWFIASRFLQGIGLGGVLISSRAIVSDLFTGKALAKQMSLMTMLLPLIFALAPTVGGILQESFQWQGVFIFLLVYLMGILIWVGFREETLKHPSDKKLYQIFSTYRIHLKNKPFLLFGINFILPAFGMFGYMATSPFLFQEVIGLSPAEYGSLALYIGGTIILVGYINLKLIHYFSAVQILFFASIIITFAGGLLLYFHFTHILTTWSLLFPSLLFFATTPLCIPNAASKTLSLVQQYFGSATALLTTFQFLAGALASFIFSLISDETALTLAICFIAVGILSMINLYFACRLPIGHVGNTHLTDTMAP